MMGTTGKEVFLNDILAAQTEHKLVGKMPDQLSVLQQQGMLPIPSV